MRINIYILTIFILVLGFLACTKEKSPYDLAKEHHKLFRCDVNGNEWAIMELDYNEDVNVHAVKERAGGLILHAKNHPDESQNDHIYLCINNIIHEGYNKISGGYKRAYIDFLKEPIKDYFIDNDYDNFIDIKYIDSTDVINKQSVIRVNIVADFEFRAITKDNIDTILVTNGEFDLDVYWERKN